MANIGGGRILRVCDLCGGVDDHPRHVIAGSETGSLPASSGVALRKVLAAVADLPEDEQDRLLNDLMDTSSSDRHYDCCATAGCPHNLCGPLLAGAKGKTGKALLTHLASIDVKSFASDPAVVEGVSQ